MSNVIPLLSALSEQKIGNAPASRGIAYPVDLNNWPEAVRALSMATVLVPIVADDMENLVNGDEATTAKYIAILSQHMTGNQWFVKLNSRSPKDASYPDLPVTDSAEDAISLIINSMRCVDDMVMMQMAGHDCFIALREYVPIDTTRELRCYVKNGKLLGVSRYDYQDDASDYWHSEEAQTLFAEAESYYYRHLFAHYETVVFDLAIGLGAYAAGRSVKGSGVNEAHLLIELNPYGLSDPCCFGTYETIEQQGGLVIERIAT